LSRTERLYKSNPDETSLVLLTYIIHEFSGMYGGNSIFAHSRSGPESIRDGPPREILFRKSTQNLNPRKYYIRHD
jgi:hypothetical protein